MSDGVVVDARQYSTMSDVLELEMDVTVTAVDIPIGLPSIGAAPRRADLAAKAFVGPMRSSIFVVAPAEVMAAPTHAGAVALCVEAGIGGLSQQAYALRHKILEVAALASDARLYEVHPEVSFAAMAGHPLRFSKRTWDGFKERSRILRAARLEILERLHGLGRASVDDVLDAVAAAWTAARIATGSACTLPSEPADDEPRIWY
jgi:predicted RNase H-like nuclease